MSSQFDYEPPSARQPRSRVEHRVINTVHEWAARFIAVVFLAGLVFVGYHFLTGVVRLFGGAL